MVSVASKEYEKRQLELIQINHEQRKKAALCILLRPSQIFQVRRTKEKDRFEFLLLSKHLNKKEMRIITYHFLNPIKVGFKVTDNFMKYYQLETVEWRGKGRICLLTLNCESEFEKKILEDRFRNY